MRKLLIVDDDELVGTLVQTVAQLDGFEVRLTDSAEAFFDTLTEFEPTHVVLDMTLPGSSGEEVLRELARRGCTARVAVISGVDAPRLAAAAASARDLGLRFAGCLPKPFVPAALRVLLNA